ncbi:hypothetical protein C8046_15135 [Serinibacter arcticus]|uniref:SUKH-4 immunity protein of toxin-antitoxin system n=1 Tax=Serinibacter arcticus TaxID=1655435 RepID=A0A2U1ZXR9_9MICO|nr:hypothetical protein [Serinibacter arcticus]PWD51779.1 hypothetical protein C8046_15135 [Serinibacter arcticus]
MSLSDAVTALAGIFGREGHDLGHLSLREVPPDSEVASSGALEVYLDSLELREHPVIGGVLALSLAGRDDLHTFQEDRAVIAVNGVPQRSTDWPTTWVVVATRGEEAVVVDTATTACAVRGSVGRVVLPLADSLEDYLRAVVAVMRIELAHDMDVQDADFNVRDDVLAEIRDEVTAALGPQNAEGFLELHLG